MTPSAHKSTHSSELFAHGLKLELDREAEGLDMATQSRLTQIRHKVLATKSKRTHHGYLGWFSGLIVAGIASIVLSQYLQLQAPAVSTPSTSIVAKAATQFPIKWDVPANVAGVAVQLPTELDVSAIELMLAQEEALDIVEEWDLYMWLVAEYG